MLLVLPNPCFLLFRELLYTAFTRQRDRVIIMHQGSRSELKRYASDVWFDTAMRFTNLFEKPKMVLVKRHTESEDRFLEERLIHRTCDGTPVHSKFEVIIYHTHQGNVQDCGQSRKVIGQGNLAAHDLRRT